MLHGAAAGLSLDELEEAEGLQSPDVVADHAEGGIELARQLAWAGRSTFQSSEDPCAQRMGKGLGQGGISDVLIWLHAPSSSRDLSRLCAAP